MFTFAFPCPHLSRTPTHIMHPTHFLPTNSHEFEFKILLIIYHCINKLKNIYLQHIFFFFLSLFNTHLAEIATLTHKFTSVTLYKNKTVRYAARMHAIIACQMEFQLYPMDIQVCPIYIESCKRH